MKLGCLMDMRKKNLISFYELARVSESGIGGGSRRLSRNCPPKDICQEVSSRGEGDEQIQKRMLESIGLLQSSIAEACAEQCFHTYSLTYDF